MIPTPEGPQVRWWKRLDTESGIVMGRNSSSWSDLAAWNMLIDSDESFDFRSVHDFSRGPIVEIQTVQASIYPICNHNWNRIWICPVPVDLPYVFTRGASVALRTASLPVLVTALRLSWGF